MCVTAGIDCDNEASHNVLNTVLCFFAALLCSISN